MKLHYQEYFLGTFNEAPWLPQLCHAVQNRAHRANIQYSHFPSKTWIHWTFQSSYFLVSRSSYFVNSNRSYLHCDPLTNSPLCSRANFVQLNGDWLMIHFWFSHPAMSCFKNKFRAIYNSYYPSLLRSYYIAIHWKWIREEEQLDKCWKRDNFVANICVVQVLRTFYLNCVTPVASRAGGGHGGKHRNLPIFASDRFSF